MTPVVVLDTLGGPSPVYLRWLLFARRYGMEPVLTNAAPDELLAKIAPALIILCRTLYTLQPCRVEACERSAEGLELLAYAEAESRERNLKIELTARYPSLMEARPVPGLDVTLTGHLTDDTDTLEVVATACGKYLKAKGTP